VPGFTLGSSLRSASGGQVVPGRLLEAAAASTAVKVVHLHDPRNGADQLCGSRT
jgi:hypothetical protein